MLGQSLGGGKIRMSATNNVEDLAQRIMQKEHGSDALLLSMDNDSYNKYVTLATILMKLGVK